MRTPTEVLARFNRQLLVDGVDLSAQQALQRWSVVVATDGSEVAKEASVATLHYLAGAGFGAVCGAGAAAAAAVDEKIEVLSSGAAAVPPVAHIYLAVRGYGASVDIVATADIAGWASGRSKNARVCTTAFDLGRPAELVEAPFIGAATADLLLNHLLGLELLPAIARYAMNSEEELSFTTEPGEDMVTAKLETGRGRINSEPPGFSLESLARVPGEFAKILDDCRVRYPNEACGYVLEKDGALHTVVCENLQDRYHQLDPTTYRRTARTAFKLNEMKIARAIEAGSKLVCIYHSHCDAGAYFSNEDVECALLDGEPLFPDVSYLVASVYGGELRATELYGFDPKAGTYAPLQHPSQRALIATRMTYRSAVRDKSSGAWTWDLATGVMKFDAALKSQLGYTDDEIPDDSEAWLGRLHPADGTRLRQALRELVKGNTPLLQDEVRVQHRDGSFVWGRVTAALESALGAKGVVTGRQEDITAIKLAELRVSYAEQHDSLTGLLNVEPFVLRLEELLEEGDEGTLCICDLLEFGDVNKRFDRLTGDDTLIAIAGLLEDQLPQGAVIGRIAGDLFGFVMTVSLDEAKEFVQMLAAEISSEPLVARNGTGYSVQAQFSLGAPTAEGRFGRAWLDRVLCGLKSDTEAGVVLVRPSV